MGDVKVHLTSISKFEKEFTDFFNKNNSFEMKYTRLFKDLGLTFPKDVTNLASLIERNDMMNYSLRDDDDNFDPHGITLKGELGTHGIVKAEKDLQREKRKTLAEYMDIMLSISENCKRLFQDAQNPNEDNNDEFKTTLEEVKKSKSKILKITKSLLGANAQKFEKYLRNYDCEEKALDNLAKSYGNILEGSLRGLNPERTSNT